MQNSCAKWQRLRTDIAQAILQSETPTGESEHILSLIKLYYADYSKLPIGMLQHYLNIMKRSQYKDKSTFLADIYEDLPIPKLPAYKKVAIAEEFDGEYQLVPTEQEGIPRSNKWNTEVKLLYFPTQANWKRKSFFRVEINRVYTRQHYLNSIPSKLDCYAYRPNISFKFKREGELDDLIKNNKFLHVLRDMILTNLYKLKRTQICQEKRFKNEGHRRYQVLCGNPLLYSEFQSGTCSACWRKTFKDFVKNIK